MRHVTAVFLLIPCLAVWCSRQATASEKISKEDIYLSSFVMNYYRDPKPQEGVRVLRLFLSSEMLRDNSEAGDQESLDHKSAYFAYFFARIAESSPEVLRDYEILFDQTDDRGKLLLLRVFRFFRDSKLEQFLRERAGRVSEDISSQIVATLEREPLGRASVVKDARDADDLDFLWIEFLVTGDREPVSRIIDVLGWDDLFRTKLKTWMSEDHSDAERTRLSGLLRENLGVTVSMDTHSIEYPGDLDCRFIALLNAPKRSDPEASVTPEREIMQMLNISRDELMYMATKSAALWSLRSNAHQHQRVLDICKEELAVRKGKEVVDLKSVVSSVEQ